MKGTQMETKPLKVSFKKMKRCQKSQKDLITIVFTMENKMLLPETALCFYSPGFFFFMFNLLYRLLPGFIIKLFSFQSPLSFLPLHLSILNHLNLVSTATKIKLTSIQYDWVWFSLFKQPQELDTTLSLSIDERAEAQRGNCPRSHNC